MLCLSRLHRIGDTIIGLRVPLVQILLDSGCQLVEQTLLIDCDLVKLLQLFSEAASSFVGTSVASMKRTIGLRFIGVLQNLLVMAHYACHLISHRIEQVLWNLFVSVNGCLSCHSRERRRRSHRITAHCVKLAHTKRLVSS